MQILDAQYNKFKVESEAEAYRLSFGGYSGDAGNALGDCEGCSTRLWINGMMFTTRDMDNDSWHNRNCANLYKGG